MSPSGNHNSGQPWENLGLHRAVLDLLAVDGYEAVLAAVRFYPERPDRYELYGPCCAVVGGGMGADAQPQEELEHLGPTGACADDEQPDGAVVEFRFGGE